MMETMRDAWGDQKRSSDVEKGRASSEDSFAWYLSRIKRHSVPSAQEERQLLVRVFRGDEKAREELCVRNLRLVVTCARAFVKKSPIFSLTIHDLVQAGNEGLLEAICRFDPEKYESRLSTYAFWWIEMSIRNAIAEEGRVVRYPVNVEKALGKYARAASALERESMRRPGIREIADRLGITVDKTIRLRNLASEAVSSNAPAGSPDDRCGEHSELEEFLLDQGVSPEEWRYHSESREILDGMIRTALDPVSSAIFREYYGIDESIADISRKHGMSDMAIHGRLTRSKRMLRKHLESHGYPRGSFF